MTFEKLSTNWRCPGCGVVKTQEERPAPCHCDDPQITITPWVIPPQPSYPPVYPWGPFYITSTAGGTPDKDA